jgi:beta-lactamase regulating signal transducer with metallopeptidase domain
MSGFGLLAQIAAERALNAIPAGLLMASLAWLALRAFGKQSSGTRFAVWFMALLVIATLPFVPAVGGAPGHLAEGLHAQFTLSSDWARVILVGWILIAAVALMRLIFGIWRLRRLRKNCTPLSLSALPSGAQQTIEEFRSARPVEVCSSPDVRVPTAIGFFKPAILIPEWALGELPAEDLKAVVLHELAHLRRGDDWTNLAQKLVRIVFFFHPAVWWIERRLALEREMACDEVVLAETANRRAYAECLVSLAEKSFMHRGVAMAQSLIGRARETSLRLARILDTAPVAPRVFKPVLAVVAGLAALCLVVLPGTPRLIAFKNVAPSRFLSRTPAPVSAAVAPVSASEGSGMYVPAKAVMFPPVRVASMKSARARAVKLNVAKQKQVRPAPTLLVRTAGRQAIREPQLLLFVRTTEYDGVSPTKVNYCVWRVTFPDAESNTFRAELVAKSI